MISIWGLGIGPNPHEKEIINPNKINLVKIKYNNQLIITKQIY